MNIRELMEHRKLHGICEIVCTSEKGLFEDEWVQPGMKFRLLDASESDSGIRLLLDAGWKKEENRKFYTYDYFGPDRAPVLNCEDAKMWNEKEELYFNGDEECFELLKEETNESDSLQKQLNSYKAAMIAYANEFPLGKDGLPDVGSIHENIRKLKGRLDLAEKLLGTLPYVADNYRKECENRGLV